MTPFMAQLERGEVGEFMKGDYDEWTKIEYGHHDQEVIEEINPYDRMVVKAVKEKQHRAQFDEMVNGDPALKRAMAQEGQIESRCEQETGEGSWESTDETMNDFSQENVSRQQSEEVDMLWDEIGEDSLAATERSTTLTVNLPKDTNQACWAAADLRTVLRNVIADCQVSKVTALKDWSAHPHALVRTPSSRLDCCSLTQSQWSVDSTRTMFKILMDHQEMNIASKNQSVDLLL
jgi:hypothetical protein